MINIKSITGRIHDLGYGGYPFKVIVIVEIPVKEFNKLCPIIKSGPSYPMFKTKPRRNLGGLVVDVNNAVYRMNGNIPAHNPSIDSQGHKKAINGIKTMEFVYFFNDLDKARNLGFEFIGNSDIPKYNQYIEISGISRDRGEGIDVLLP